MVKHEFGIMQKMPILGKRYDEYEPDKYNCIAVHDDYIEVLLEQLSNIDFYWHTLDVPGKGLAYFGITLMPPTSLIQFIDVIDRKKELVELKQLLMQAQNENKYVIHFGI